MKFCEADFGKVDLRALFFIWTLGLVSLIVLDVYLLLLTWVCLTSRIYDLLSQSIASRGFMYMLTSFQLNYLVSEVSYLFSF